MTSRLHGNWEVFVSENEMGLLKNDRPILFLLKKIVI